MSVLDGAEVIVIGPAPPLRGGIAAHTACLVECLRADGVRAAAASYRRLYPSLLFPGRGQRGPGAAPPWSEEILDVLRPGSWLRLRRALASGNSTVVLQWWHPSVAPALLAAISGIDRRRLVAVCHNVLAHERLPGASLAARRVLGRCARVVCHSLAEAAVARRLLGIPATGDPANGTSAAAEIVAVPLPCLLSDVASMAAPGELPALVSARIVLAAGHLRPYKGTEVLLEAWRRARRPPQARLVLAGESYLRGRARRAVAAAARNDPSIVLIDRYVEDAELVCFVSRAEILVAAYLTASQSGLLPMARSLGVPCIVSDAGGLPEQIAPDGSEVVRAGNAGDLTLALERRLARGAPDRRTGVALPRRDDAFLREWRAVVEAMGIAHRP